LRRWLRHIRPAQDSEHARKHGKGSKVLHGKRTNWLTIESQPAPEKALSQSVIQSPLVLEDQLRQLIKQSQAPVLAFLSQ
jgi:hypothetical protein